MTLTEFWNNYYLDYTSSLRESTLVGYESAWRLHIQPEFGDMNIKDITVMKIETWLLKFPTKGVAKKAYSVLRAMLNLAYKWEFYPLNLCGIKMKFPKGEKYTPDILSLQEMKELLEGFKGHELEPLLICECCLGLRKGEACGLMWKDINFHNKTVKIERSRQYVRGKVIVVDPKTEKSKRTLHLPKFAVKRLKKIAKKSDTSGFLCNLSPEQISKAYKQHCQENNLKYVSMTNLRHSYATGMLDSGVDATIVAKILGHTDVSTTNRYYLNPLEETLTKAQNKFEKEFLKNFW